MNWMNEFVFSEEVYQALNDKQPVVALESTIISHGMPFPQNLEVARNVEHTVRANGAVPATIAILDGKINVGLNDTQLECFSQVGHVIKCSRRDLAYAVSGGFHGATTVSATMIIAEMAGIELFATGGIGGVHRGAESTFDVSADLTEFAKTSVAVVSAGAKAILDIPKTLEYLETLGVPVVGYQTDYFPAFYSRSSGMEVPMKLQSTAELAAMIHERKRMNLSGGILIANPIPEDAEIPAQTIEPHIEAAIAEARKNGISGKALTPYLLRALNKVTGGLSQQANERLVLHNARVAAQIAVDFTAISKKQPFIAL